MVAVALPAIGRNLHVGFQDLQWTVTSYTLTLASPPGSKTRPQMAASSSPGLSGRPRRLAGSFEQQEPQPVQSHRSSHAHTQVLGKLAVALAPPEPQLQHTALRLTARGWETLPLPAPDGTGALVVALDLRTHQAIAEHSDGRSERIALTPNRPVGEVTRDVLAAVRGLAGPVAINPRPQETPWTTPLDEDDEHATYDPAQVTAYFAASGATAVQIVYSSHQGVAGYRAHRLGSW